MKLMDKIRKKFRSFLRIDNQMPNMLTLSNLTDFETELNLYRIWSWGDKEALEQAYKQLQSSSTRLNFWAAVPSQGIVKRHTGLPGNIVNMLTDLIISDMGEIVVESRRRAEWEEACKKINMKQMLSGAVKDTLITGDGAFKFSIDTGASPFPEIEFVSGENVEFVKLHGRIKEIRFTKPLAYDHKNYVLEETYGYGYVNTRLWEGERKIELAAIPALAGVSAEVRHPDSYMMAVPLLFFESNQHKGRGKSIYAGKTDNFDALDEIWSQWMDALRKGRSKEYIPKSLLPMSETTGELLKPNPFDHAFIDTQENLAEGASQQITLIQPAIPHESYMSTYITALDLCLQGIISPSTLGIDTKKLDNAEAQREKEKTTLYTRNRVVSALQEAVPAVVDVFFKAYDTLNQRAPEKTGAEVTFGEYANPSFESQVETIGKAKSQGIMSLAAAVDELYGDSRNEEWKQAEVLRLKEEQGIVELGEPSVSADKKEAAEDYLEQST